MKKALQLALQGFPSFVKHRGTGFARPLVLPPAGGCPSDTQ